MKRLFFFLFAVFLALNMQAEDRYSISLSAVYGYNETFGHLGGFDLTAYMPINKYFEMDAALEYQSPKTCAVSAFARPKFPLPVGEIFLEGATIFRYWGSNLAGTFSAAGSLGYRMDYVSVQVGLSSLVLMDMTRKYGTESENVTEPFNFIYRLAFNVRPATSPWNIHFGFANFSPYEVERCWQPLFFLGGQYDINKNFTALLDVDLKPTGLFHLNARFWGMDVRLGAKYRF